MPEDVQILLDQYREKFGKGFPLMQASDDWDEIRADIQQCLTKGISADKLDPEHYGACLGIDY
ncbi:MAG: hypothetical protein J5504_04850 [Butyrivibrio sp.]|nr:hypothetical protein [Butyrivibrio sp.]